MKPKCKECGNWADSCICDLLRELSGGIAPPPPKQDRCGICGYTKCVCRHQRLVTQAPLGPNAHQLPTKSLAPWA